jgi:arsenate reductase-like glutaredoxin family protein
MIKEINEQEFSSILNTKDGSFVFIQQNDCHTCHEVLEDLKKQDTDKTINVYTLNLQSLTNEIKNFLKMLSVLRTPIIVKVGKDTECMVVETAEQVLKFIA